MKLSLIKTGAAALIASAVLVACGGGGSDQYAALTRNAEIPMTVTNAAILTDNGPMVFASGVPAFGTTTSTTVSATGTGTNGGSPYNFTVADANNSASGVMTFGSCIFKVTASTFTTGPLVLNAQIEVNPCQVVVQTSGQGTTGTNINAQSNWQLGTALSNPFIESVTVSPNGTQITVTTPGGGTVTATLPAPLTGAGG